MQVNDTEPIPINTEIQVFTFLTLLIKNKDKIVDYEKIAEVLGISSGKKGRRNLQFIKRDIFNKFMELGFGEETASEIRSYVRFVHSKGATLNP